jgi:hypothetical protein
MPFSTSRGIFEASAVAPLTFTPVSPHCAMRGNREGPSGCVSSDEARERDDGGVRCRVTVIDTEAASTSFGLDDRDRGIE